MTFTVSRRYDGIRFNLDVIREIVAVLGPASDLSVLYSWVTSTREVRGYPSFDEWAAGTARPDVSAYEVSIFGPNGRGENIDLRWTARKNPHTAVKTSAKTEARAVELIDLFDPPIAGGRVTRSAPLGGPTVFVGHGRSAQYRDLKDHLIEQHRFDVQTFESGSRAGHTIRDILEQMLVSSSIAFLVLTGEDLQADDQTRARQNVVHEVGLFQGRLGWHRAIVLVEHGVEHFSNIDGIVQIRYAPGNIRESFGDVLGVLRREFPGA